MKKNPLKYIVKGLTGKEEVLRSSLSVIYTGDRLEPAVRSYRLKLLKTYLAVGLVTIILIAAVVLSASLSDRRLSQVERPEAGSAGVTVPVTVQGKYKGHTVESTERLDIGAMALSEKQKQEKLSRFSRKLPDRIVPPDQSGVRMVTDNLDLPARDQRTGIEMRWESSDPGVLSEDGKLDVFPLNGGSENVTLSVVLTLENISQSTSFDVLVSDAPESYDASLKNELKRVVEQISGTNEGKTVVLPEKSEGGIELKWWKKKDSSAVLILVAGMFLFLCIFGGRYDRAKKNARKYRDSVIADFPAVVDKLVLLLNSGLTVFSALMRISSDYADENKYRKSPAAVEIAAIGERVQSTNSSVIEEWKKFATRMESGDILRFCTILEDNLNKGSELSTKLENESEELRDLRKKNIQKYIRSIDSKMMIPMMMMLFSLILVTVAPVITGF